MRDDALFCGIDAGSAASKCVIVDAHGAVVGRGVHGSGAGTQGPAKALAQALQEAGASWDDVTRACATGYGRKLIEQASMHKSELSCHARAVGLMFPDARTVIDIGGQDAKVLRLGDGGQLETFAMNDKCAAGTGRFLEVMARVFGCEVDELSALDERSTEPVAVSSTCTVFAESEVISKMASGIALEDIAAGVHEAVAERTAGLANRVGVVPQVVMTGGVAQNARLRARLADKLGCEIALPDEPQLCGALGAALYARGADRPC